MVSNSKLAESDDTVMEQEANIVKSPLPEIEPVVGVTISEFLRASALKYNGSNAVAFECLDSGVKYTHKAVFDMSRGFAAGLIKLGVQRRNTVAVVLPNIPEYASVLMGIWDAGCICTTINHAYGIDEMKLQLDNSEANYVVTLPIYVRTFQEIQRAGLKSLKIIVVGDKVDSSCISFWDLVQTDPNGVRFLAGSDIDTTQEVALLPYSSGTTGLPKGVMLTHSSFCTNLWQMAQPGVLVMEEMSAETEDPKSERFIALLPFFHSFGMLFCMVGLRFGAHVVTMSKFEQSAFLKILRTHKPTVLQLVPPIISMLVNNPLVTKDDFKTVKSILSGAAPLGPTLINRLLEKAEKSILFQEGYGMTEMSPATHVLNPQNHGCEAKIGSIGCLIPSTMAKVVAVVGSGRHSVGPYESGELWVKGPQMMKGYFKNEEASKDIIDSEGWLHTGDIVYYDADSCFYVVDRLKELIKVKGEQVAPAELENTLREHPMVQDAAVIGIPDEYAGELPRAYIVPKSNILTEEEVKEFVKSKLAHFKQLKGGVEFVDAIPKAPSGKILRRVLRQKYAQHSLLIQSISTLTLESTGTN